MLKSIFVKKNANVNIQKLTKSNRVGLADAKLNITKVNTNSFRIGVT